MGPPTKTTPKPSKPEDIHPLTPTQTNELSSVSVSVSTSSVLDSTPLRRRSLRLASVPNSEPPQLPSQSPEITLRVSNTKEKGKTMVTDSECEVDNQIKLRSGKKVLKRGITTEPNDDDSGNSGKKKKVEEKIDLLEGSSSSLSRRRMLTREEKGKAPVVVDVDDDSDSEESLEVKSEMENKNENESEKESDMEVNEPLQVREQSTNSSNRKQRGSGRNDFRERFRDIARENASRFALFPQNENNGNEDDDDTLREEKDEIEDWPGPFSTAMKIIKDREKKGIQIGSESSQASLFDSIKWTPKTKSEEVGVRLPVTSLKELCLQILAKNVDAIVSLESVPDALRHRLSQLLCDSRRINNNFFELLVGGNPTEIRLRDCSWLTEDQFTKCFQACDTSNLVVLQLDQCGRCLPDYVIVATLARSPRQLPRLTSLSLSGACRLSDGGLRALVSCAPTLRSMNLSQCSLLTSASVYILAETLKPLLKELYLDNCQGIDASLIVPGLVELEHLELLSVAGLQTVCDKFVKDYIVARGHNIKELILKDCINLTDASIKVIAEHCPGLCVLDLMGMCKLTDLSIGYLTNGCRALNTLKLCRNSFSDEAVAAFIETTGESLKELSLNNIKKVGYHTTLSLASHGKRLHTLDLSWCRNLTDNALGLIVDGCMSLRLLKLFGCTQVTDVFLNGHSNPQMQIIGIKMSPVLQHVKVPDPHQGPLNYSSVTLDE